MENRITKKDILTVVKAMAEAQVPGINLGEDLVDAEVTAADIVAYCDTTIAQLEAKKEKAAETRAKKAAQADALKEQVLALITSDPKTRDDIFVELGSEDPELSIAKVGSRLTKLVAEGVIVKEPIKVKNAEGKSVSKMAYKLA